MKVVHQDRRRHIRILCLLNRQSQAQVQLNKLIESFENCTNPSKSADSEADLLLSEGRMKVSNKFRLELREISGHPMFTEVKRIRKTFRRIFNEVKRTRNNRTGRIGTAELFRKTLSGRLVTLKFGQACP